MAAPLGGGAHLAGRQPRRARIRRLAAEELRARDAPLPLGRAPRRPPQVLRGRRRDRPLPSPQRLPGDPPDGLRRLRPARGEQRDQDRRAPPRRHRGLDRELPRAVPPLGHLDRLVARDLDSRPRLLPLDPVDLPPPVRARPRLPRRGPGPVVPQRRHRARQRAGDRRPLRALRHPRRDPQARAVVLPDHRLRRPPARRLRPARILARARRHACSATGSAAPRAPRSIFRCERPPDRLPGLHHPPRHPLRRDLLRPRPRAPRGRASRGRDRARGGGPPLRRREPPAPRPRTAAPRTAPRPASRSAARSSTPSTARRSRCSSPTTC